jgi:diguanylate cyclase (GGDEF)-like protein/PAS domain S-box-containing protein
MNAFEEPFEALKLAALVYQHSHQAMMVLDHEGKVIDVNPMYTTLTGYGRSEVVGRKLDVLRCWPEESDAQRALWTALREKGHWAGEVWNRRKNGQVYPEWLELNAVRNAQGQIVNYVAQAADVSTKKNNEHHIWRLANYDKLTGLPNRSMFSERLEHEIRRAHRSGRKLALLFLDLDGFKDVNDNLGHDVGDLLLQHVANRLSGCVRESDTIARLGGDEFVIILNEISDIAVVGSVAHKIVTTLSSAFTLRGQHVHVSASAGITLYPDDGETFGVLLKNADQAMYAAKHEGRNRYCYFTPAMQEQVNRRARMASELRLALASNQFHVLYQPIVNLRTRRIVQAEALARWQHPLDGLISPAVFIPLAEESGLMPELGKLVLRAAMQLARRICILDAQFVVSVNASAAQFDGKEFSGHGRFWPDMLAEAGLPASSLVVEITESTLLDTRPALQQQLQALRAAGISLAIDDFGTGYTSLQMLKKHRVDFLKLDRSFVRNLGTGGDYESLCDAAITMAHRLGMRVVAEGVETEAQCRTLLRLGCDYAQGYLFAEPIAGEAVAALLEEQLANATAAKAGLRYLS